MVCRTPRPYPKEFKQGALDLVRQGDRSIADIARELGIAESCLRRWIKQSQLDRGERDDGLSSSEREELNGSGARTRGCVREAAAAASKRLLPADCRPCRPRCPTACGAPTSRSRCWPTASTSNGS
jgi:transposase-like protein